MVTEKGSLNELKAVRPAMYEVSVQEFPQFHDMTEVRVIITNEIMYNATE